MRSRLGSARCCLPRTGIHRQPLSRRRKFVIRRRVFDKGCFVLFGKQSTSTSKNTLWTTCIMVLFRRWKFRHQEQKLVRLSNYEVEKCRQTREPCQLLVIHGSTALGTSVIFFDVYVYGIVPQQSSPPAPMSCPTNQVDPIDELSPLATAYSSSLMQILMWLLFARRSYTAYAGFTSGTTCCRRRMDHVLALHSVHGCAYGRGRLAIADPSLVVDSQVYLSMLCRRYQLFLTVLYRSTQIMGSP